MAAAFALAEHAILKCPDIRLQLESKIASLSGLVSPEVLWRVFPFLCYKILLPISDYQVWHIWLLPAK